MVKIIAILAGLLWWVILSAQPQPPLPQITAMQDLGRQSPYLSSVSVVVTQTVTTVYELTYLRAIRVQASASNTTYKTNFLLMDTNTISIQTNISNHNP